jgi:hypothetical protein
MWARWASASVITIIIAIGITIIAPAGKAG